VRHYLKRKKKKERNVHTYGGKHIGKNSEKSYKNGFGGVGGLGSVTRTETSPLIFYILNRIFMSTPYFRIKNKKNLTLLEKIRVGLKNLK
jgi:hypothetical protein